MSGAHFDYGNTSRARDRLRFALAAGATVLAAGLLVLGGWRLAKDAAQPKKRAVQQISVVRPPLPPKPPPEPERPKEEVKEPIRQPEPEQAKDDAPPPSETLGLDAKGTAGSDGFGLQGRPGGRDITTIGAEGDGKGRGAGAFYATQLQGELQALLNRDEKLRGAQYRALVKLWLDPSGAVKRVEIAGSTGDAELDERLRGALGDGTKLPPPPQGTAQPVRVELVARRT